MTELKEQLRRLKQPVSGTKSVLQERLKAALLETPVAMTSVKPVGSGAAAAADNEEEGDDEDQILPPEAGEEVAPRRTPPRGQNRAAVSASWADREAPDYGAQGGKGGGWRADEEQWDDAAEDGVELGAEMEAEVSWVWMMGGLIDCPSCGVFDWWDDL